MVKNLHCNMTVPVNKWMYLMQQDTGMLNTTDLVRSLWLQVAGFPQSVVTSQFQYSFTYRISLKAKHKHGLSKVWKHNLAPYQPQCWSIMLVQHHFLWSKVWLFPNHADYAPLKLKRKDYTTHHLKFQRGMWWHDIYLWTHWKKSCS